LNFFYHSLAAAAGKSKTEAGEELGLKVDLIISHDGNAPKVLAAWPQGGHILEPQKVVFTVDHLFPSPTAESREEYLAFSSFAAKEGIRLYKKGEGVLHQVIAEKHPPFAGMIIAGADGHVATSGAFGAIAFSVTPQELVEIMLSGRLNLKVPETYTVEVVGDLKEETTPRDLALYLLGELGKGLVKGKALLLQGKLFENLSLASRMTVTNLIGEMGAVTGLIVPAGRESEADLVLEAQKVEPMIAAPPQPTNVHPLKEYEGLTVTQVVVGGCGTGRLEDMEELLSGMGEEKVAEEVTLLVVPASAAVLNEMDTLSLSSELRLKGAVILPPGCGPCPGLHAGLLAPGERALSTTVRNTPGRMGSDKAEIYLASSKTAGRTAVKGFISS